MSNLKSLRVNNSYAVGKGDNKYVEQTNSGLSTNQNRPIFNIAFRSRAVARLVSVHWVLKLMVYLFTNYYSAVEDCYMEQFFTSDCMFLLHVPYFYCLVCRT
jgi:hypothetical protein